jgi:hypothetical protein
MHPRFGVRRTYLAKVGGVPRPEQIDSDLELERIYLERWSDVPPGQGFTAPGRQIVHCTFGSVLTHDRWGPEIRDILATHIDTYTEMLREHFARHLQALRSGM